MIIGIDGNEANVIHRVGISEYAFELLIEFNKLKMKDLGFKIYLKSKHLNDLPKESENWKYQIVKPSKLWTQIGLPFNLFAKFPRPNVFFSPTHYAPRFSPVPTVISIMDLSYIFFPDMFKHSDLYQLQNWTRYSVKKAKRIFTISNSSKNDIIKIYHVPEAKIVVTYPGIKVHDQKLNVKDMEELKKKYDISGNYILFVGTLQPRKNIQRLIEAFSKLVQADSSSDVELVIVGKKGWLYEEILEAPQKFKVEKKVKFLDFVSQNDLPAFYHHAQFFVLPSLYEGFGLPVLEAMSYGCPVITSNVSSLPEAGGEAALYVNPENVSDITDAMKKLLTDKKLRVELVKKGYEQVKKFSWEKTAQQTLSVLQEVVRK